MEGNRRDKLKLHRDAQRRHRLQRIEEVIAEGEYKENVKDPSRITGVTKNPKRFVDEAIPSNAIKWLESYHPKLVQPYINYVSKRARTLDKVAKFFSNEFGIELHKEHPVSVSGAGDVELSPTTPISDRGPNTEGFSGNARFNRRLNRKNAFSRADLEQLNIATNWQGSVSDFVANRPDITDQAKRKSLELPPLKAKTSDLGMLKLQQGDLNVDQLEMKQFIENDLKKSGIALSKNDSKLLENYISSIESKEQGINAAKHGDNWDLKTKFKHSTADQRLAQRVEMGQNAVKRQNPKFTKLATEVVENGDNGTNGTNGIKKPGSKINLKKLGLGAAALTIGSNFLPSKAAAEEIRDEVSQGELGDATKTYAKDLLIGHTASRSLGSILKLAKSKLSGNIAKKVIGRQLLKKGAALATGPAAPIVMGGLLIKDAYDVANVISGDKLKIRENKDMSTDERKKAVERLKFIK